MRIHGGDHPMKPSPAPGTGGEAEPTDLMGKVVRAIKGVYDPEIPINIYDLGLIYDIKVNEASGTVAVAMTLTTPNCPEAQYIPGQVRGAVEAIAEVKEANVEIVWDPPWSKERMSDEAKLHLGLM
jgi:FeS assembly SUF system protein